jgi:hypothetical protein
MPATIVEGGIGGDKVGLADRTEHFGEVGAELRVMPQHLAVPQARWHNYTFPVGVDRLAGEREGE